MKATGWLLSSLMVAAIVLGGALQTRANFMYDLVFSDGTKTKTVEANQTYTLNLWAYITGDTNQANDSWQSGYASIDPGKVGAGAFYNPGNSTAVGVTGVGWGSHISTNTSNTGVQNTLLSFADNIKGWGGASGSTAYAAPYWSWRAGSPPGYVGGTYDAQSVWVDAGTQKLLVGLFTVRTGSSINASGTAGDMTTFNVRIQDRLKTGTFTTIPSLMYNNDDPDPGTWNLHACAYQTTAYTTIGSPVQLVAVAVPEPGTVALAFVGGLMGLASAWMGRRRPSRNQSVASA